MINLWSVIASAIASMIIGSIWYGPLFGKKFMHIMGMDKMTATEKMAMFWLSIGNMFITLLVAGVIIGSLG